MKSFLFLVLVIAVFPSYSQDTIQLPRAANNAVYLKDASHIKPGTVILLEGDYLYYTLFNVKGTADKPIILINKGLVRIGGVKSYTLNISGEHYKILGNGDPKHKYGILLNHVPAVLGTFGINLNHSSNIEIAHVEITNCVIGIAQNRKEGGPQENCYYHDNYIHDLSDPNPNFFGRSEGFYLGSSDPKVPYGAPFRFVNARVENNIIEDVTGDGIQCANGDFIVKNNIIKRHGLAQLKDQCNGIQIGGNATAKVINNVVDGGKGTALIILGVGDIEVTGNKFINIDLNPMTTDLVYIDGRVGAGAPKLKLNFYNNYIQGNTKRYALNNVTKPECVESINFSNNKIEGRFLKPFISRSK